MADSEEKQCRICLDGPEPSLGRLIKPCLCTGSIRYVHVKCLQQWMNLSASKSAFYECPQCKYKYRFSRTKVLGIAGNPVVVGALSSLFFTILVLCSSFITTYFMNALDEPSTSSTWYYSRWWINPFDVGQDLIRAAYRILTDQTGLLDDNIFSKSPSQRIEYATGTFPIFDRPPPGLLKRLFQRFVLGLPIIGAGSIVHMLMTMQFALAPVQWLARQRGSRNRRGNNSRDIAAFVILILLVIGAARALYKVYELTQRITRRLLLRAEDAILEVN